MRVRRDIRTLTAAERAQFIAAWEHFVTKCYIHGFLDEYDKVNTGVVRAAPAFLPWHRDFINRVESFLGQGIGNSHFALPYWDWTADAILADPKTAPIWASDFMGAHSIWMPHDDLGVNPVTLPSRAEVEAALSIPVYDVPPFDATAQPSFRNAIEKLSDRVLAWVAGTSRPNDPVFFLHFANIDRLWAQWQARYPQAPYRPAEKVDRQPVPSVMGSPASVLVHNTLGYRYDTELTSVALIGCNQRYVCAEGGGGRELVANREGRGPWETFELVDLTNDRAALRASNGQYVCAENGGGAEVVVNRSAAGPWETFDVVQLGSRKIALRAANGQYVCAENAGDAPLVANRDAIGPWETFELERLNLYALVADNNAYLSAEGAEVVAHNTSLGANEKFDVVPVSHLTIALRASNGKFVCAEHGGGDVVVANRDAVGPWEMFTLGFTDEAQQIRLRAGNAWVHTGTDGSVRADPAPPVPERDFVLIPV